jgi:microcystin degradation protein MlrC
MPTPKRIVFCGFQHETNTFAPTQADLLAFERGGGWPGLARGEAVFDAIAGSNIPAAGFVDAARRAGHTLLPSVWGGASPSAHVAEAAYEQIVGEILAGVEAALPVDAVYLDLHGAMVATHFEDGEGELLRRVRALVGDAVPVVGSLDLHANVTAQMLASADALVAYRTYPHVDMARTGRRAFALLEKRWASGPRAALAVRRLPFLVPICWQCTDLQPAARLYALLEEIEAEGGADLSFATGFPAADFAECSPVIWAYADDPAAAEAAAERLARAANEAEAEFAGTLYSPDDAVRYAIEQSRAGRRPIVIADGQDNPGAGANSDTTGMLRALIGQDAQQAAIGLIVDPAAAEAIHERRVGDTIRLALGGRSGIAGDAPYEDEFVIEAISDGKIDATGPYYAGFRLDVGPAACLRRGGVRIVVASFKVQMADQALFRLVGIEPAEQAILVVKSAVHFRADFAPIAAEIIVGAAPGPMPMRLEQLPWSKLAAGMRLGAKGHPFEPGWTAAPHISPTGISTHE